MAPNRRQAIIWIDGLVYWRIYAVLGFSELTVRNTFQSKYNSVDYLPNNRNCLVTMGNNGSFGEVK